MRTPNHAAPRVRRDFPASAMKLLARPVGLVRSLVQVRMLYQRLSASLIVSSLLGCSGGHRADIPEEPAIIIRQLPDYPSPDRGFEFPGGLVAAFFADGRMVRATAADEVGRSYVEGMVNAPQCDVLLQSIRIVAKRVTKSEGIVMHAASQYIRIRTMDGESEWTRTMPDRGSSWSNLQAQLFDVPLTDRHPLALAAAEKLR